MENWIKWISIRFFINGGKLSVIKMMTVIAGTYEILYEIGFGGGGIVYLANHLRLNKNVVLKADKRKITAPTEVLRREVDVLKNLSHTYIPQVYDFFVENEVVYTVIDFVEGESLDKPLKRGERFVQSQVIKWACEILEALCYLHNPIHGTPPRGIVHSDIKPANIMLTPNDDIKLIDFNIALALGEESIVGLSAGYASPEHYGLDFSSDTYFTNNEEKSKSELTETQETKTLNNDFGEDETVSMVSLERANIIRQENKSVMATSSFKKIVIPDARSDIYSLGATLYHLLSGKRPKKNATEVEPLSTEDFSPLIVSIISKAMNPNPDLRYQSAEEMLYDFRYLRENDPRTKKKKRIFKFTSVSLAGLMIIGVFTSFVGLKRMESVQKALTFAEYSQNAIEKGDTDLAVEYALQALPIDKDIFNSDYIAEAKKALADSLEVYNLSDSFKSHKVMDLPSEIFKTFLSPNGKTGVVTYSFEVAIFDAELGSVIESLPMIESALSDVVYINDDIIAYAGRDGLSLYNIKEKKILWTGEKATHIAVSEDGKTIVGIYRDETFATVYDVNGNKKATLDFAGNRQKVVNKDIFSDPMDNILAISGNGRYVAVSFENGGLVIYDLMNLKNVTKLYDKSEFTHFEGGFNGKYFAFSGTKNGLSEFKIVNIETFETPISLVLDSHIGVKTNENVIYISNKSTICTINPLTGEQQEVAFADSDIREFSSDLNNSIVLTEKNECLFYDKYADFVNKYSTGQIKYSFAEISGDFAIIAGRDTPTIRILKRSDYSLSDICNYDKDYIHDEARINQDMTRLLLFSYRGFRLYDLKGNLIKEVEIPDKNKVYDQQYSSTAGNLAVIYDDAFRLYSGENGNLIYENENLKSVSYSKYGVSIFDGKEIKLIDIDSGEVLQNLPATGKFGAYCGMVVDDNVLNGGKFIGSAKIGENYVFAVEKDNLCKVYDDMGNLKFEIPVEINSEAFFTNNEIILSPLHGTPTVFSLESGKKVADLEKDAYVTYITELDDYIMSEYVTATSEHYGILIDKITYEKLAYIPCLTDILNGELIFDYHKGYLRKSKIYSIEELINIAKSKAID